MHLRSSAITKRQLPPQNKTRGFILITLLAIVLASILILAFSYITISASIPPINSITEYRPKAPLRVFTSDGYLIGEFGHERRSLLKIKDIPKNLQNAFIAIEDARFYEHKGIDPIGVLRALRSNASGGSRQGASTITMQVVRNVFLTPEKTLKRKLTEAIMAYRLDQAMTKQQILELYLNQIYLGQRAYGVGAAAFTYFGKELKNLTLAEMAMLAGLPKAPSLYNPVINPERARIRQHYVLLRMKELGMISQADYQQAINEPLKLNLTTTTKVSPFGKYVAELVRKVIYDKYGQSTYEKGFSVYTTINKEEQEKASRVVQKAMMAFDRSRGYRGPEGFVELVNDEKENEQRMEEAFVDHPDTIDLITGIVTQVKANEVTAYTSSAGVLKLTGSSLRFAMPGLVASAQPKVKIKRGSIIRLRRVKTDSGQDWWEIGQIPLVQSGLVGMDFRSGAIRALVGGFDFDLKPFNNATQAWRQPGSSIKPLIYSAALEHGMTPATLVNDAPLKFKSWETGGRRWNPKNSDGHFSGPISLRNALIKSKNLVSIRVMKQIGSATTQQYLSRFGLDPKNHPPYLTTALGAGSATVLQMASAYAVFASGGLRIKPYLIERVIDPFGKILMQQSPEPPVQVIDPRNAFIIDSMMRDVVRLGTAKRALSLGRNDIAGKTGTTNDEYDAWFVGYGGHIVAATWVGYEIPQSLGRGETGGALALPIWIEYMRNAIKDSPAREIKVPAGIVRYAGDYAYAEGAGASIKGIDVSGSQIYARSSLNSDDPPIRKVKKPRVVERHEEDEDEDDDKPIIRRKQTVKSSPSQKPSNVEIQPPEERKPPPSDPPSSNDNSQSERAKAIEMFKETQDEGQ